MGKVHDGIDERLREFITAQHLFFVATAPSGATGHVNLSPKGRTGLAVIDAHTVAYLDKVGSGAETIAHVRENGRITLMLCAFEGPPKIVRLHGIGEVIEPDDARFPELRARFAAGPGDRSIIVVRVARVSDSCGYAIPLYDYRRDRETLDDWADKKGPEKLAEYQKKNNVKSLDGLPALRWTEKGER